MAIKILSALMMILKLLKEADRSLKTVTFLAAKILPYLKQDCLGMEEMLDWKIPNLIYLN